MLLHFDREIRKPFLSAVLHELHKSVEDATMAAVCAIDRVVLPVDVLDYPARVIEFKKKSERAARKRAKQEAADSSLRAAEVLAAAAVADDSDNSDSEVRNKAELVRVDPQSSVLPQVAEMDLKESQEAAASFEQDAAAVETAIGLFDEDFKQLKSEHAAWRSYLLDAQQELVAADSNFTIKHVLDFTKCRIFRVNQRSTRSVSSRGGASRS